VTKMDDLELIEKPVLTRQKGKASGLNSILIRDARMAGFDLVLVLLVTSLVVCDATAQIPKWDLPAPTDDLASGWSTAPSVPNYTRTYLYIPEMLPVADPLLIAVSSAGHLEPGMVWMIKVVVSARNYCQYCLSQAVIMAQHSGFSEDDVCVVQTNIEETSLSERIKALLRLASEITESPHTVGPYVDASREAGWEDPQIAQAIHVASAWNYTNRFALAFGVEPDWLHPYDPRATVPIRTAGTEAERKFLIEFLSSGGEK